MGVQQSKGLAYKILRRTRYLNPRAYFELLVDKDPGSRVQRPEQKIGLAFGNTIKLWDPDQQHST